MICSFPTFYSSKKNEEMPCYQHNPVGVYGITGALVAKLRKNNLILRFSIKKII